MRSAPEEALASHVSLYNKDTNKKVRIAIPKVLIDTLV